MLAEEMHGGGNGFLKRLLARVMAGGRDAWR
jgi:hypothetical protein